MNYSLLSHPERRATFAAFGRAPRKYVDHARSLSSQDVAELLWRCHNMIRNLEGEIVSLSAELVANGLDGAAGDRAVIHEPDPTLDPAEA